MEVWESSVSVKSNLLFAQVISVVVACLDFLLA
jgi:hypothetical protein